MTSEKIQGVCEELQVFFKERGIEQYQFFFVPDTTNASLDNLSSLGGLKNTGAFVANLHSFMTPIFLKGARRLIKAAEETTLLLSIMGMSQNMAGRLFGEKHGNAYPESTNKGGMSDA